MYIIVLSVYILYLIWGGQGDMLSHMGRGTTCYVQHVNRKIHVIYHLGATVLFNQQLIYKITFCMQLVFNN